MLLQELEALLRTVDELFRAACKRTWDEATAYGVNLCIPVADQPETLTVAARMSKQQVAALIEEQQLRLLDDVIRLIAAASLEEKTAVLNERERAQAEEGRLRMEAKELLTFEAFYVRCLAARWTTLMENQMVRLTARGTAEGTRVVVGRWGF